MADTDHNQTFNTILIKSLNSVQLDNSRKYSSVLCKIKIANVFLVPTKCVLQRPADARDNISISSFEY